MQIILLFVTVNTVLATLLLFKAPISNNFHLKLNFPTLIEATGKEIYWTEVIVDSDLPEAFRNETLSISSRIYDIDPEYFKTDLESRSLIFTFEGLNPIDDIVPLQYDQSDSSFKGSGKLTFPVAGKFKFQFGYNSSDLKQPRKLISASNIELPVLSSETKYQLEMTRNVFSQSKIILILTIIMAYLAISEFLEKFLKM